MRCKFGVSVVQLGMGQCSAIANATANCQELKASFSIIEAKLNDKPRPEQDSIARAELQQASALPAAWHTEL
jgi:hypothetical protein